MIEEPDGFLNYPGDRSKIIGQIVGPSTLGDFWRAVSCDYDPAADKSRVGFVYVHPSEVNQ